MSNKLTKLTLFSNLNFIHMYCVPNYLNLTFLREFKTLYSFCVCHFNKKFMWKKSHSFFKHCWTWYERTTEDPIQHYIGKHDPTKGKSYFRKRLWVHFKRCGWSYIVAIAWFWNWMNGSPPSGWTQQFHGFDVCTHVIDSGNSMQSNILTCTKNINQELFNL